MTYHRSMMPGTKWSEGRKANLEGGMYRISRKPGPIQGVPSRDGLLAYGLNLAARVFAKQHP